MFKHTTKQFLNIYLFNILEELILFKIFEVGDIAFITDLCIQKLKPAIEQTNDHYNQSRNDNESNSANNTDYLYSDLCEYKCSIFNVVNMLFLYFYQVNKIDILDNLKVNLNS